MTEARMKLNENGRVVIPSEIRVALGIQAGDELVMRIEEDELRITTLKRRIEQAQNQVARYKKHGRSLVDELIELRRQAARHERESGNHE
ncbi:MAG TPA: AbrB/MazE/SpoVT family DNA-binding domain-containing protein [Terracidiphilus sp.]